MITRSLHQCHGGQVGFYIHDSRETKCPMNFAVFLPPTFRDNHAQKIPYLLYLSGLGCTEENFILKANAFAKASELGLAIIVPDTSPRGPNIPDDPSEYLGQGAGLYIDAIAPPWSENYRMESYIIKELLPFIEQKFDLDTLRKSICGQSMGGHGALTFFLKYPELFRSCSVFAPVVNPSHIEWTSNIFSKFLGNDQNLWKAHDACELIMRGQNRSNYSSILIDQGTADPFLNKSVCPKLFESACEKTGQNLTLRWHEGYDHGYFFIQTFMNDHLEWHARYLK